LEEKQRAWRTASLRKICHHGMHSTERRVAQANVNVGSLDALILMRIQAGDDGASTAMFVTVR